MLKKRQINIICVLIWEGEKNHWKLIGPSRDAVKFFQNSLKKNVDAHFQLLSWVAHLRNASGSESLCFPPTALSPPCLLEGCGCNTFFSQKIILWESEAFPGRCLFFVTHVSTGSCHYQGLLDTDFSCNISYLHKNTLWHPAPAFIGRK